MHGEGQRSAQQVHLERLAAFDRYPEIYFANADHPVPVVFNLSSWARRRLSITQWLVNELRAHYGVPRKTGQDWVDNQQVLPLLDGLDEVAIE